MLNKETSKIYGRQETARVLKILSSRTGNRTAVATKNLVLPRGINCLNFYELLPETRVSFVKVESHTSCVIHE